MLCPQRNPAECHLLIEGGRGQVSAGIPAFRRKKYMDTKKGEAATGDAGPSPLGGVEVRPQIQEPGLKAGITNLLDLVQHAQESIEAGGIDRPRIRLRSQTYAVGCCCPGRS